MVYNHAKDVQCDKTEYPDKIYNACLRITIFGSEPFFLLQRIVRYLFQNSENIVFALVVVLFYYASSFFNFFRFFNLFHQIIVPRSFHLYLGIGSQSVSNDHVVVD